MSNVKRSTLYFVAACLAVVLLCCCVGGIYFASRGQGRGAVKAEALNQDLYDQIMESEITALFFGKRGSSTSSSLIVNKSGISASAYIIHDEGSVSYPEYMHGCFALSTFVKDMVRDFPLGSATINSVDRINISFSLPDGSTMTLNPSDGFQIFSSDGSIPFSMSDWEFYWGSLQPEDFNLVATSTVGAAVTAFESVPLSSSAISTDSFSFQVFKYDSIYDSSVSVYVRMPGSYDLDSVSTLPAPVISFSPSDSTMIVWDPVANATGYNIYRDGVLFNSLSHSYFKIPVKDGVSGLYHEWQVQAVGSPGLYIDSELSNSLAYGTPATQLASPVLTWKASDERFFWEVVDHAFNYSIFYSASSDGFSLIDTTGFNYYYPESVGYYYVVANPGNEDFLKSDPSNIYHLDSLPDPDPDPDPDPGPTPPVNDDPTPPEIMNNGTTWLAHGRWSDTSGGLHDFTFYGNATNFKSFLTADDYGVSMQLVYEYLEKQLVSESNYESIDTCTFSIYFGVNFIYTPVSYSFLYTGSVDGVTVQLSPVPSASISAIVLDLMDDDSYHEPYMVIPSYFNGALVDIISFNFLAAYNSMSGTFLLFDYLSSLGFDYGYDLGHDDGYSSGLTDGYNNGFNAALNDSGFMSLMTAVVDAPIKAFMGLFDIEIMGFNIAGVLIAILSIALVTKVIALFM